MKLIIKYCDNKAFLASFPPKFFHFCYIDPPYNTKSNFNKSHADKFLNNDWIDFITSALKIYRTKTANINFNFMSLGSKSFHMNARLFLNATFITDKTALFVWKRQDIATSTYNNNFEYIFYWSARKETRINKKRITFHSKPLKYQISEIEKWYCLESKMFGAPLRKVDFTFENINFKHATVSQETLKTLYYEGKLKLVGQNLYGLLKSAKYNKFSKIITDFSYNASNHYQKKYLSKNTHLKFEFSKPWQLIFELLHYHHSDETKNIVDFFCGSGSTADAVIRYNKQFQKDYDCYMCDSNIYLKDTTKSDFYMYLKN